MSEQTELTESPEPTRTAERAGSVALASKVPQITVLFWVVKILTTGMGEATSDALGNWSIPVAGLVGVGGFALALWLQIRAPRYLAGLYWFAVVMVAVFGTMAADGLHVAGVPYLASTSFYAIVLAVVFVLWHRSEGTLSIHSITTRRRENYYWVTVFATFALGTATGDLTATTFNLGFFWSGVLFTGAILVPLIAWRLGANAVLTFWAAYVLTRPLGASFADWLGKPPRIGGLDYGDPTVAISAGVVIAGLVAYLAFSRRDVQPDTLLEMQPEAEPA